MKSSNCLLYADDAKFYKKVLSIADCIGLQLDIDSVLQWCKTWMISINVKKCAFIHFSLKRKIILSYSYTMLGQIIPSVTDIKDLGEIFTSNFSFNKHINDITSKSFRLLGFLKRVLKPFKDRSVLLTLYLSLIRQKLEYASFIWAPKAKSMCDKIERVQKKFFKFMCFQMNIRCIELSYSELCYNFNVQSLSDRRKMTDLSLQ